MEGRICSKCHVSKPAEGFTLRVNGKLRSNCRDCVAYQKSTKRLNWSLDERKLEAEIRRYRHIRRVYRISAEEYDALILRQDDKCAICKEPLGVRMSVDHDHRTDRVRGILCKFCNPLLGYAKDDIKILQAAINYLLSS